MDAQAMEINNKQENTQPAAPAADGGNPSLGRGLTPEQAAAVGYRGGALLVSAAAGSGKTKVLVERLLSRVDEGANIDDFLVITYTRAAAAELRNRILEEIGKRIEVSRNKRHLRRQSMLCHGAQIDTIHAFCTSILREFGHLADLPPDFRVADESECKLIKADVLNDLLDEKYDAMHHDSNADGGESMDDGFRAVVDALSTGRDDKRLVEIILDIHAKLLSNPNPRAWVEKQIGILATEGVADVSETIWGRRLMEKARSLTEYWISEMSRTMVEMYYYPEFYEAYGDSFNDIVYGIEAFRRALDVSWDETRRFCDVEFPRPQSVTGYDELKDVRIRCRDAIKKCAEVFECTSKEHVEDMQAVAPVLSELLRLVLEFDRVYTDEKRRRGVVDFSDLEHIALSLLVDAETGDKTELARTVSFRFKEIMVDEYQDVNAVQETIFNAVSQDGGNIFMVGDVKQSIYRFRLADPSIFLEKYRRFADVADGAGPVPGGGAKIMLSANFRSRARILDVVNHIFENIMSREFGEMDYTERERLVAGRGESAASGGTLQRKEERGQRKEERGERGVVSDDNVEIYIIDMSAVDRGEDEESPAKTQVEAQFVARRVSELVGGGYMIPDDAGEREVRYSDIVILLRSMQNKAGQYAAALAERGIPVDMPGGEGFFETVEVEAALSLLSVIDNPMQDIPLAATLSGPVFRFTPDDLAEIRAGSRNTDFYSALAKAAASDAKCAEFLDEIESMRSVMQDMPADRFIHFVYNRTGLLGLVGAMLGGERRRENLLMLAEHARAFGQSGYRGLFDFLTYIRGLKDKEIELPGEAASPSDNAVRIMSIHKSKGLEFPIVFLADTSKRFNNADATKPLVMHQTLGIGAVRTDKDRRIEYPTLAQMAVRSALTSEMMAEELRVLYVAMTRAREKLIITAAFEDAEREIEKLKRLSRSGVSPQAMEETKNMAKWIIMPLLKEERRDDRGLSAAGGGTPTCYPRLMLVGTPEESVGTAPQGNPRLTLAEATVGAPPCSRPQDEQLAPAANDSAPRHAEAAIPDTPRSDVEILRERFKFIYPQTMAPDLPSKLTVTELSRKPTTVAIRHTQPPAAVPAASTPYEEESYTPSSLWAVSPTEERGLQPPPPEGASPLPTAYARPGFIMEKSRLTASERGTALHLAMQHVDIRKCSNDNGVRGEIRRLANKGIMTTEQASIVDVRKITRFFKSDIGKRILDAARVEREFKFSLLYPAEYFYPGGGEDKIMLQGVIDCFFEEAGDLTVIDFKTDYVTRDTLAEKIERYTPQIAAYADALERITQKQVRERLIYFFIMEQAFPV